MAVNVTRKVVVVIVVTALLVMMWPNVPRDAEVIPPRRVSTRVLSNGPVDPKRIGRERSLAEVVGTKNIGEFNGVCPMLYPANHTLVNTGRKALVLYTMTSVTDVYDRQVEIDNFLFFRAHAMMPPNTPTALFSSVDYVIMTSDLSRKGNAAGKDDIAQCAARENVRVLEGPNAPCDLCAQARVINTLGGAAAVARDYEFVMLLNSGARGPFFTEAPVAPRGPPPVTWLDHFALGGEKVYTGAIMTGVVGMGERPYMTSFAAGFPGSVFPALHPVLVAGCSEVMLPRHWKEFAVSFDAELHTMDNTPWNATKLFATLQHIRDHPETLQSTPQGFRDAAAKKIDEKVAAGARIHHQRAIDALTQIANGNAHPPFTEWKMKCVYRAEVQILNTVLRTKLSPEEGDTSTTHPSWLRRPKLSAEQRSQLSPVLAGYLHEGHYFAHSLHHRQTVVNMGHATIFHDMGRLGCNLCGDVLPKYGGVAWRSKIKWEITDCAPSYQSATMGQQPRRLPPVINVGEILRCPNRARVDPFLRD